MDADISDADLQKLLTSTVRIVTIHRFRQSRCIKLVFDSANLPAYVKVRHVRHPVRPYVTRLLQCHKCCKLGHDSAVCKGGITCQRCVGPHKGDNFEAAAPLKCSNCFMAHETTSKDCTKIKEENRVLRKVVRDNSTQRDAASSIRRHRRRSKRGRQSNRSVHRNDGSSTEKDCAPPHQPLLMQHKTATPVTSEPRPREAQSGPALRSIASEVESPSLPPVEMSKTT
ncbi:hypothetical protein HPB49_004457 [Dermacentor silvarum]|uniref:Uncharacterized protein n=1 Tax=Dermacentor silvarum TaxID=543639 RepID=A0ACB8C798_DERSI|nr:hypothetical protein HPB49_004457 [Dermacentor silvarum]